MHSSHRGTIAGLTVAGALAGVASALVGIVVGDLRGSLPVLAEVDLYITGSVFGLVIATYFWVFLRIRSVPKLLLFVVASICADVLAIITTMHVPDMLGVPLLTPWSQGFTVRARALVFGGSVGAFVLLAAAHLLFSAERQWRVAIKRGLQWCLAGGTLAVIGWSLGGSLGKVIWLALHSLHLVALDRRVEPALPSNMVEWCSLSVVWQAGVAAVIGYSLSKSSAAQPKHQSASA